MKMKMIQPAALVSLTTPKLCALDLKDVRHYLGGRFLPKALAEKYGVELLTGEWGCGSGGVVLLEECGEGDGRKMGAS